MTVTLLSASIVALGVVTRAPIRNVVLVLGAVTVPVVCLAVVLVVTARAAFEAARSQPVDPAVATIVAVAGELKAGRTLRAVATEGHFGATLAARARHGLELDGVPEAELRGFGSEAPTILATLALAARSGAAVAHVFERLAADLIEVDRTRRDRRAAMAPAIAQAVVVAGVPVVALAQMVASGRWLDMMAAGTVQAAMLVIGTAAVLGGVLWIGAVMRTRSRP